MPVLPLEREKAQMGSCRHEGNGCLKSPRREREVARELGGARRQSSPTGPACVARKEPGNEAQDFDDGGFNWPWSSVDLPWMLQSWSGQGWLLRDWQDTVPSESHWPLGLWYGTLSPGIDW